MKNPGYKCYNCPLYSEFDTVIKHSIVTHSENTLKCRRPLIHLSSVHKCKLTGLQPFHGHLGYRTKPIFKLRREIDKSNIYVLFGSNQGIND